MHCPKPKHAKINIWKYRQSDKKRFVFFIQWYLQVLNVLHWVPSLTQAYKSFSSKQRGCAISSQRLTVLARCIHPSLQVHFYCLGRNFISLYHIIQLMLVHKAAKSANQLNTIVGELKVFFPRPGLNLDYLFLKQILYH